MNTILMRTPLAEHGSKYSIQFHSFSRVSLGLFLFRHKLRQAEMEATTVWATALNKQTEGKHHIGDFLPPEELKKFMEKYDSKKMNREPDISDYKEYKLNENNKGECDDSRGLTVI